MMTARQLLDRVLAPIVGETGDMLRERLRREIRADNFAKLAPRMLEARIFTGEGYVGALEDAIGSEPIEARPSKAGAA